MKAQGVVGALTMAACCNQVGALRYVFVIMNELTQFRVSPSTLFLFLRANHTRDL